MSDEKRVLTRGGSGVLVDAQGQPIAPPVDDDVKAGVAKALADPYIRKLIVTQVTSYHVYAAARDLLEKTEYSIPVKQGLIAAVFHELFDPDTKMCRPFDFGKVRERVKNNIVPFLPLMAGKFMAEQDAAKQKLLDADQKLRVLAIPFFKAVGHLERGEIYVFWTKPEDVAKVMELLAAWMSKLEMGLLWLSQFKEATEDFGNLRQFLGQDINIAPADASADVFTTRRNTILNVPLMHMYLTDAPSVVFGTHADDRAISRFKQGLVERKSTAVVIVPDDYLWPLTTGHKGRLDLNSNPDADLEDALIANLYPDPVAGTPADAVAN